jgi:DNA mismatch repair ATPase MutS
MTETWFFGMPRSALMTWDISFGITRLLNIMNSLLSTSIYICSINLDLKQFTSGYEHLQVPLQRQQHLEQLISSTVFQYLHETVNPYVQRKTIHSVHFEPGPGLVSISHKYRFSLHSSTQQNTENSVVAMWCEAVLRVETGRYPGRPE